MHRRLPFESPVGWSLLGVLADCGMEIFGKVATYAASPWQATCLRWAFGTVFLSVILMVMRRRPRMVRPSVHLLRLLLNLVAGYCYFAALSALPLALVVTLINSQPLFVVLAASLLLKERLGARRLTGVLLGLAGVTLTAQPWAVSGDTHLWPLVMALGAAVAWGLLMVITRGAGRAEGVLDLMFWLALLTTLATLPLAWLHWQPLALADHGTFFVLAFFGLFSSICWLTALKLGDAGLAAGVQFLTLPATYVLAYLFFGERLALPTLAGGAIVLCGVALVILPRRAGRAGIAEAG